MSWAPRIEFRDRFGLSVCIVGLGNIIQASFDKFISIQKVSIPWNNMPMSVRFLNYNSMHISRVSCQKGPTRHAYAWQIGSFWQDTLDMLHWIHGLLLIILSKSRVSLPFHMEPSPWWIKAGCFEFINSYDGVLCTHNCACCTRVNV